MSRYASIRNLDVSNGKGLRVSIFFQGCHFHCKDCFNEETWDFDGGEEFTKETIERILDLSKKDYIKGLSILGGEPLNKENLDSTIELCKEYKQQYPDKDIWVWTGYTLESILNSHRELFKYIDVLIDGRYEIANSSLNLAFRGSSNQRVIDIKETLRQNKIILKEEI